MDTSVYKFKYRLWLCYAGIVTAIVLLFFRHSVQPPFCLFDGFFCLDDIFYGITLTKISLLLLNISLSGVAFTPLEVEDERVERMRNYAFKYTFRLAMIMAVYAGFFLTSRISLLVYAVVILVYYIVIFRLCLYRDSEMVYMTDEQLKNYDKKSLKRFNIFFQVTNIISILAGGFLSKAFQNMEIFWMVVIINIIIIAFTKTIYFGWRS